LNYLIGIFRKVGKPTLRDLYGIGAWEDIEGLLIWSGVCIPTKIVGTRDAIHGVYLCVFVKNFGLL